MLESRGLCEKLALWRLYLMNEEKKSSEKKTVVLHITETHLKELCEQRKLEQPWVLVNCKSIKKEEASELLGYISPSPGLWIEGSNYQGQFKPDKPWISPQDKDNGKKRAPKYRSPKEYDGLYDAMLINHPYTDDYWTDFERLKAICWQINDKPFIVVTEGAFKAIAACSVGIPTVALLGVEQGLTPSKLDVQKKRYLVKSLERLASNGFNFIIAFDADCVDNESVQWAQKKLGKKLELFGCEVYTLTGAWQVDPTFENKNKGIDDYIANFGGESFKRDVLSKAQPFSSWLKSLQSEQGDFNQSPIQVEELYTQKAFDALYSGSHWISIDAELYKWCGTHYKKVSRETERRRISQWCKSTPVEVDKGRWKYAYATATHITNIYNWVTEQVGVSREDCNPPGLNCLNGVLNIVWEGAIARWELTPHNPEKLYTYVSEIKYNPTADPSDCEKLLSCLDKGQQKVFLQTLAASLDLAQIRRFRGREVRALLLQGHGNNGKDSLRESVRLLYGGSLVGATIADFAAYDQGRKFPLAKLQGSLISWSSENTEFSQLDKLQSLKAAITGDPIYAERKGADEEEIFLSTVFLFSVNDPPTLKAGLEAIRSRWAVLRFSKTFKVGADPSKGEIEADSRFRYDPYFLKDKVVPALLNKMLNELKNLAVTGIDYSCTENALESIQRETNHLWAFAQDVGLKYQVGGRVYISDLWHCLRSWYIGNGTLVITTDAKGKEKTEWYDQARTWDKNVKGANQIYPRLKELFPKIEKGVETVDKDRKNQAYLSGVALTASPASPAQSVRVTASPTASPGEAVKKIEPLPCKDSEAGEAGEAVLDSPSYIPAISPWKRQKIEQPDPCPFKKGDKVKILEEPGIYTVKEPGAPFSTLEEKEFAVSNWFLYLADSSVGDEAPSEGSDTDS